MSLIKRIDGLIDDLSREISDLQTIKQLLGGQVNCSDILTNVTVSHFEGKILENESSTPPKKILSGVTRLIGCNVKNSGLIFIKDTDGIWRCRERPDLELSQEQIESDFNNRYLKII